MARQWRGSGWRVAVVWQWCRSGWQWVAVVAATPTVSVTVIVTVSVTVSRSVCSDANGQPRTPRIPMHSLPLCTWTLCPFIARPKGRSLDLAGCLALSLSRAPDISLARPPPTLSPPTSTNIHQHPPTSRVALCRFVIQIMHAPFLPPPCLLYTFGGSGALPPPHAHFYAPPPTPVRGMQDCRLSRTRRTVRCG